LGSLLGSAGVVRSFLAGSFLSVRRRFVCDNGARVKTSQALRDAKSVPPIGIPTPHVDRSKELPQELYSNHSCRILASFLVEYHSNSFPTMTSTDAAPQNEKDSTIPERDSRISALSLGTVGFVGEALSEHSAYGMTSRELCRELIYGEKSEKERDSNVTMMSI
jgi:hypothetical protein